MVDRKLAGAHYGLRDWIVQRATAVVMVCYTAALLSFLFFFPSDYPSWKQFFSQLWVKLFTQLSFIALFLHAWVGIRDLWMDYIKPFSVRLFLQVATVIWLLTCLIYSVYIIWGAA